VTAPPPPGGQEEGEPRPWKPAPDSPELHAELLQIAAVRMTKHGDQDVAEAIRAHLLIMAYWEDAAARVKAAQVAAEAAALPPARLLALISAAAAAEAERGRRAGEAEKADRELEISEKQRKIRGWREAHRREDKREAGEAAAAAGPVVIRSGDWLTGQRFDPVAWAVPGLIPEGVTILSGPPKGGKSWLVLSVALSLAAGHLILGALENGPRRPVLYLALEDSDRRMKARCARLGYDQIPPLFSYITECSPGRVLDEIGAWMEPRRGQRPLVTIDTWAKIAMPAAKGETIYDRDYRLGGQVKALAAENPGASVWINHHVRKQGAADFLDTVSGTAGVAGSADTVAVLVRKRHEFTGRLHVTGRDVEEDTYQLGGFPCWELDGGDLSAAAIAARAAAERENLGERSAQILDMLSERGQMTTGEVADALRLSSDTASVYLGRLYKDGKIDKERRGMWKVLVPPVGSVGRVGNKEYPNRTNMGYKDWHDQIAAMAEEEMRKRGEGGKQT
jgi:DNA-binding transcriptional ArsR family regulator